MTKQEFIQRQETMTRSLNRRLAVWMVFFFAAMLGCIPLSDYIEKQAENYRWIGTAIGIGFLIFLLASLGLMAWFGNRQQKRYGHRCPHCHKPINGFVAQIAIASGNCAHCGEKVFDVQPANPPS